jgi:hypothetical protein
VEHIDQARVILRHLFVLLDALEFALERSLPFKVLPPNDFDRAIGSRDAAREKDLSVRSSTDSAEDLKLWDNGFVRI